MLGSDGFVYNTQCPTVGAWVAPESRPPSIQRASPDGKVEIVATEADGVPLTAPNDLTLRARRPPLLHRLRRLGPGRTSRTAA